MQFLLDSTISIRYIFKLRIVSVLLLNPISSIKDIQLFKDVNNETREFLFDKRIIYRTDDQWGDIMVLEKKDYRILAFDPVYEQSCINIKLPHIPVHEYTRIMLFALAFVTPEKITLLGLGGGCLLNTLNFLLPQCSFYAIELRETVIQEATPYFALPTGPNVKIRVADARLELRYCEEGSTQIIFADMYHSSGMNPFQMHSKFIKQCHRILDDSGCLVVNYHKPPDQNLSFIKCLQQYFAEVLICPVVGGNYILYAMKSPLKILKTYQETITRLETDLDIKLTHLFKRVTRIPRK